MLLFYALLVCFFLSRRVGDLSSPARIKPAAHAVKQSPQQCAAREDLPVASHRFISVFGLLGRTQPLSGCGVWSALSCGAQPLTAACLGERRAQEGWLYLQPAGLVALCQGGSLWTCDQAHVPCVSRLIPKSLTTREAPQFLIHYFPSLCP